MVSATITGLRVDVDGAVTPVEAPREDGVLAPQYAACGAALVESVRVAAPR